ncbi:Rho termination factor N-terminal domain-containing protein [Rhodocaloribacter litoris]|uniref:Rho termination factor N-terminal domain-containing protein n=1 Tax=Rhodocaloribacter litoris TaxID=2558931 RepID=UPI001E617682|nr:Rho termination factor N-terminal domain-containing protein [Rhodocaloribacter litoris]QXD15647.1 Rho termination factor N-terminal domain-containing protein [Rhodocaloribacter litoris]
MHHTLARILPFANRSSRLGRLEIPRSLAAIMPAHTANGRTRLLVGVTTGVLALIGVAGSTWYYKLRRRENATGPATSGAEEADTRPYAMRTRDELYEMAQERDIPGRSQMTKAELVEALRRSAAS